MAAGQAQRRSPWARFRGAGWWWMAALLSAFALAVLSGLVQTGRIVGSPLSGSSQPSPLSKDLRDVQVPETCAPLPISSDPASFVGPPAPTPSLSSRSLTAALSDDQLEVTAVVVFDRCSPELQLLLDALPEALDDWRARGPQFSDIAVGQVYFSGSTIRFNLPKVRTGVPGAEQVTLEWPAKHKIDSSPSAGGSDDLSWMASTWLAPAKLIVNAGEGRSLWLRYPRRSESELITARLEGALEVDLRPTSRTIRVDIGAIRALETSATATQRSHEGKLFRTARDGIGRLVSHLMAGLFWALPFVLLLRWAAELDSRRQEVEVSRKVSEVALALVAVIALGTVVVDGVHLLAQFIPNSRSWAWSGLGTKAYLVAVLWPAVAGLMFRPSPGFSPGVRVAFLGTAILLLVALTAQMRGMAAHWTEPVVRWSYPEAPIFSDHVLPAALLTLVWLLASMWLLAEIGGWRRGLRAWVVVVVCTLVFKFFDRLGWLFDIPWTVGASVVVLPMGWIAGSLTERWLKSLRGLSDDAPCRMGGALGLLVVLLLIQPSSEMASPSLSWQVTLPTALVIRVWAVLAIASVVVWMKAEQPAASALPQTHSRAAMIVILGFATLRVGDAWGGALAQLGLTWLLVRYWLFTGRAVRSPRLSGGALGSAIRELRATNELWRTRRSLYKSVADKLSKLEIRAPDYVEQTRAFDEELRQRDARNLLARGRAAMALNRGGAGQRWALACRGAALGTVVSIPWMSVYLFNLKVGGESGMPVDVVLKCYSVLVDLAIWPALGFLLMYFYPYFRGRSGIQKGAVLTAIFVLPAVLSLLMTSSAADLQLAGFFYWSLQVFICCMVVAVCLGDVAALRGAGRSWSSLVDVYNVGTLAAWSSTVALAIAGAISAALAGGAGQIVGETLKKVLLPGAPGG